MVKKAMAIRASVNLRSIGRHSVSETTIRIAVAPVSSALIVPMTRAAALARAHCPEPGIDDLI
jgi:hypothetical protein